MFDNGVMVWEAAADVGFPVKLSRKQRELEGRKTSGLVAFFDIRGFTAWSEEHNGSDVQGVVGLLEREIQAAFGRAWLKKLFLKGTGDGALIVSENGWRRKDARGSKLQRSDRAQFMLACCRTVEGVRAELPKELAVGCAVNEGTVIQVYVLGRHDYLGLPVNVASKLQALAWNEVCLSPRFYRKVLGEGLRLPSVCPMASRAVRVPSAELVKQWANKARSPRRHRR
jgi:class 3 adenylate cyclase